MSFVRRHARIVGLLAALCLLVLLVLLLILWARARQATVLPTPSGPYPVGRVGYDWVDPTRAETLGPDPRAKRELMVWVWYPAVPPPAGAAAAAYLPPQWARARNAGLAAALLTQHLDAVRVHATADSAISPARPSYPVLVLEPGLGPLATDYTVLAEDLASHGYVVLGLTPTYSASVVVFPDGRAAWASAAGSVPDSAPLDESRRILDRLITVWTADVRFALNQLERLNGAGRQGRFSGRLDLRHVGVVGHSFGGATAAEACRWDARCRAGVDIDGYPYGDVVQGGLSTPFMFMWSEPPDPSDAGWQQAVRDTRAIYDRLAHGRYQIMVRRTRHFNFADYAVLYAPVVKLSGALGPIDGRRGLAITTAYVRSFFDTYLKGSDTRLLHGPSPDYPEVEFDAR